MIGSMAMNLLSYGCIGIGLWFWLWGTWPLLGDRSVLYKLHGLSVSDTLGSMLIIVGLLAKIPREWPLLLLALISLAIWNTVLGYVLAYCSMGDSQRYGAPNSTLNSTPHNELYNRSDLSADLPGPGPLPNLGSAPEVRHDG